LPPMTRPGLVFAAAFMASTGMAMFALTTVQERLPELAPMDAEAPPVAFELLRRPGGPGVGPIDAPILIVEFSDFECPFCSRLATSLAEIKQTYGDRVRIEFRHFPLSFHANARPAAVAAECAHEQGEFWAFHDLLFRHHRELDETRISAFAQTIGLDEARFAACRADSEIHARVDADLEAGQAAGVTGTPVFFINGVAYVGGWPASRIAPVLDALDLPAP
jgi:protein-disulfide isomerase